MSEYCTSIDFSFQLSLAGSISDVEQHIVSSLIPLRGEQGSIIVLCKSSLYGAKFKGMLQMKPKKNPITEYVNIQSDDGKSLIYKYSSPPYDGAIVIGDSGQILGAGVYLEVLNPILQVPDDCGTRHKAAASFSQREDIFSVITLSEETAIIRIWKAGSINIEIDCEAE